MERDLGQIARSQIAVQKYKERKGIQGILPAENLRQVLKQGRTTREQPAASERPAARSNHSRSRPGMREKGENARMHPPPSRHARCPPMKGIDENEVGSRRPMGAGTSARQCLDNDLLVVRRETLNGTLNGTSATPRSRRSLTWFAAMGIQAEGLEAGGSSEDEEGYADVCVDANASAGAGEAGESSTGRLEWDRREV